jgi:hypothetical protein
MEYRVFDLYSFFGHSPIDPATLFQKKVELAHCILSLVYLGIASSTRCLHACSRVKQKRQILHFHSHMLQIIHLRNGFSK